MGDDLGPLLPEAGWPFLILMLVVSAAPIAAIVLATIIGIVRHRRSGMQRSPAELPAAAPVSIDSRLTEIDNLLAAGRIAEDEHAARRGPTVGW